MKSLSQLLSIHVIGVCLPSQSVPKKHNQEKSPQTFAHLVNFSEMCPPCLIIIQSCYCDYRINKPSTYSRCVICVSCSVHLISTYYVRKKSEAFFSTNHITFIRFLPIFQQTRHTVDDRQGSWQVSFFNPLGHSLAMGSSTLQFLCRLRKLGCRIITKEFVYS